MVMEIIFFFFRPYHLNKLPSMVCLNASVLT